MKAVGQFAGGISAYNAGKYTRSVMNTNAANAENAGVAERDRVRAAAGMAMGQQSVDQGGSGFQSGTGSALDQLKQSAINRELDLAVSRSRAGMAATNFKQQGAMAYANGKAAMAGGILSGAATIAETVAGGFGGAGAGGDGIGDPDLGATMPVNLSTSAFSPRSTMSNFDFGTLPGMGG